MLEKPAQFFSPLKVSLVRLIPCFDRSEGEASALKVEIEIIYLQVWRYPQNNIVMSD